MKRLEPRKKATLVFLLNNDQILLAMKKRGFGMGYWNGIGGKPEAGETMKQAAIRECQEEIVVTPVNLIEQAVINFYFEEEDKQKNDMQVHVYICTNWSGNPIETEEMAPAWFNLQDIPYANMWPDDKFWLPLVLDGKKLKANFSLGNDNKNHKPRYRNY